MKQFTDILNKLKLHLLILVIAALIVTGCNLPGRQNLPTETPQLVFPTFVPSNTPVVVIATATEAPAATALPSAVPPTSAPASTTIPPTAAPIPTSIPNAVRFNFATGATAGIVQGELSPGKVQNFLVGAAQGQPLIISVDSLNHDVTFSIVGLKDGKTLVDASQRISSWQTILTVTQDYLIRVAAGSSKENFTLNVITPARIKFDPGSVSATVKGFTPGGLIVSYVLRASANQQMDINLNPKDGNVVLSIYGYQDGQPYMRSVVESTTFSMKLPATQDYIVQVVPRAGQIVNYTMDVTIK